MDIKTSNRYGLKISTSYASGKFPEIEEKLEDIIYYFAYSKKHKKVDKFFINSENIEKLKNIFFLISNKTDKETDKSMAKNFNNLERKKIGNTVQNIIESKKIIRRFNKKYSSNITSFREDFDKVINIIYNIKNNKCIASDLTSPTIVNVKKNFNNTDSDKDNNLFSNIDKNNNIFKLDVTCKSLSLHYKISAIETLRCIIKNSPETDNDLKEILSPVIDKIKDKINEAI